MVAVRCWLLLEITDGENSACSKVSDDECEFEISSSSIVFAVIFNFGVLFLKALSLMNILISILIGLIVNGRQQNSNAADNAREQAALTSTTTTTLSSISP